MQLIDASAIRQQKTADRWTIAAPRQRAIFAPADAVGQQRVAIQKAVGR
jgi:hypothetical protein